MIRSEIEEMLENYGADAETMRTEMRLTRMTTDEDISAARDMCVAAYLQPYLRDLPQPFTTEDPDTGEEVVDEDEMQNFVRRLRSLIYARLLYSQLYRTEYTTAQPTKINATTPSVAEVSRQIGAYRRDAISALIDYYRSVKGERAELPKIYQILGEEL